MVSAITFERTDSLSLVRCILTSPYAWPHVGDDFAGDPKEFLPNGDPRIWYVLAMNGPEMVGLFTFLPRNQVLWEGHIVLMPRRRPRGTQILREGLDWMFEHSTAQRIIAEVPTCNKLAVKLVGSVMEVFGLNSKAFRKHGKLQDLILFGASKTCPAQ